MKEKLIYFAYENAGDSSDAVTVALMQLNSGLSNAGLRSRILLPDWRRLATASAFRKIVHQIVYLMRISMILLGALGRPLTIITLDAPSGLRLVVNAISRFPQCKLTHVLWVMDLYRISHAPTSRWSFTGIQKRLDEKALKQAENLVVLGDCMADLICRSFDNTSTVIPIWQETCKNETADRTRVHELREILGLEGKLVVLYSGTARAMHPLQPLIEAASLLRENSNICFLIAGRGPEIERVKEEVRLYSLPNLIVLGYMPAADVPAIAAIGDVHVVSLAENATGTCVPSKGYAGMAAGKPVLYIGSPVGQLAMDIRQSNSGLVVGEKSSTAIVEYLLESAANHSRRLAQGGNGREFFEANRTLTVGTQQWIGYLNSL